MPSRSVARTFFVFYVTLGLVVLVQSVRTVVAARTGGIAGPDALHATILGALEAGAAVGFLVPRTMRVSAALLLVIFAMAFALHAVRGDWDLTLLVYAAGVLLVHVHGVGSAGTADTLTGARSDD